MLSELTNKESKHSTNIQHSSYRFENQRVHTKLTINGTLLRRAAETLERGSLSTKNDFRELN